MNEQECLNKMVAPGTYRPGKYRGGVIQIWVTRACDKSCFGCTQGSNLGGKTTFITPRHFEIAVRSLKGYWGVIGMFGGNPAVHPDFIELCDILKKHIPLPQRGLWCNNPILPERAAKMRETFNPAVSNINTHLDKKAEKLFRAYWPEAHLIGTDTDSRHSPVYVAMKDVIQEEEKRWELISNCDINQHWSAMIGVFRGRVKAWFCEIAGAQSMLHQDEPDYPDTGYDIDMSDGPIPWWKLGMEHFRDQVRKHCHECGVPLRGYGELAQQDDAKGIEQTSVTHANIFKPKRIARKVEQVTDLVQLNVGKLARTIDYLQNAQR